MRSSVDSPPLSNTQKADVLEQLALIVHSEFFRSSRRCSSFLEYSVHYVLEGRSLDSLKERSIGVEVFGKSLDYDTAQENVVRVTANEVRKRLAQYYAHEQHTEGPEIHLKIGSYAVYFEWFPSTRDKPPIPRAATISPKERTLGPAPLTSEPQPEIDAPPLGPRTRRSILLASSLAACTLLLGILWMTYRTADVIGMVWGPIFQSAEPAVISIAQPYAYRSSSDKHEPLGPGDQAIPTPDAFVGIGDAFAMANIVDLLSVHRKEWQLIPSNVMPSRTLLAGPIILIGNRSNKWSRGILEDQRFFFGPADEIFDRNNPNQKWSLGHLSADWKTNEDYAIVSRFTNSASGQPVIVIAGISIYGTQAAGDFMTNPTLLKEALKRAPTNWRRGNFQFVLHTKVIENTPERPTVVAWDFR